MGTTIPFHFKNIITKSIVSVKYVLLPSESKNGLQIKK